MDLTAQQLTQPAKKATFNRAVDEAFARCTAVSNQRGGEYADSWAVENQVTSFLDHTIDILNKHDNAPQNWSDEGKRLIMLACLCDVKISRMQGGWKLDTLEDLLNYTAAFATLSQEYIALYNARKQ
jgi:hypothetical protein